MTLRGYLVRIVVPLLAMTGLAPACGGKTLGGSVGSGEDSGTGAIDGGGARCVTLEVLPSDLSCESDQDCTVSRSGNVCEGDCVLECGRTPINVSAAARNQSETSSLSLEDCPCLDPGEPRCLGGQCAVCGFGPNPPAGCNDDGGVVTIEDGGIFVVDGGEPDSGTSDAGGEQDGGTSTTPGCRSAEDCPASSLSGICSGPISPASLCAREPACSGDSDCTDGDVCSTGPGAQAAGGGGGPTCRPACASNDDCNYWEACQPDGKCQPLSCDQCPSYLTCTEGACGPKACAQDSECPGAYCVDNTCFASLGTCVPGCG
jgi:hypothetical protein